MLLTDRLHGIEIYDSNSIETFKMAAAIDTEPLCVNHRSLPVRSDVARNVRALSLVDVEAEGRTRQMVQPNSGKIKPAITQHDRSPDPSSADAMEKVPRR